MTHPAPLTLEELGEQMEDARAKYEAWLRTRGRQPRPDPDENLRDLDEDE